jgi:hypothetical protein
MDDDLEKVQGSRHPTYRRDVWDAAHKLATAAEIEPIRIAILTRRLYDLALGSAVELS